MGDLLEKDKQCKSMQKDDNKSKALTDRISLLERQKYELDTKTRTSEMRKVVSHIKSPSWRKRRNRAARNLKTLNQPKRSSPNRLRTRKENQQPQPMIRSPKKNSKNFRKKTKT